MGLEETLSKFPNAGHIDKINMALAAIASGDNSVRLKRFEDIQELVKLNLHHMIPVGDAFSANRETSLSASVGDSTGITAASVNEETFLAAVGEAMSGVYEASYDGAAWHKENGDSILLSDYGITVTGTPVAGDHVVITETASTIILDVVDHDKNCGDNEQSLEMLSRDVVAYGTIPFDAPELMYYAVTGLAAGTYKFTLDHGAYGNGTGQDGTYMFTIAQAIPAGGGFRHSVIGVYQSSGSYTKAQVLAGKFTTYGAQPARTSIETNIATAEYDGSTAIDLGTFTARDAQYSTDTTAHNFTERQGHGSNRYSTSAARQWLNSAGKAVPTGDSAVSYWWAPQHVFDMPPNGAKLAGFLHGLDPALVNVLGTATIVCSMPDPDRTAGLANSETLYDKVFLPSMTEIYSGNNISVAEGSQYDYFNGTGNSAKIKYHGTTARYWWLRSAYPGYAYYVRIALTSGALYYHLANIAYGLVPGLIIKSIIA